MSDDGGRSTGHGAIEAVIFRIGAQDFVVAREGVRSIHPSRRKGGRSDRRPGFPIISLSNVLGLRRDTSGDLRVLEVVHQGRSLGLEVTAMETRGGALRMWGHMNGAIGFPNIAES